MAMTLRLVVVAVMLTLVACSDTRDASGPFAKVAKIDQSIIDKHLGKSWSVDSRIMIPDVADLSGLSKAAETVANMIAPTMQTLNVRSVYDLSASPARPDKSDNLSVKVLVFETPVAATDFARAKYDNTKSGFEKIDTGRNTVTYRGIKHGKIVKIKGNLHVSVMRLNNASENDALATAFIDALPLVAQ